MKNQGFIKNSTPGNANGNVMVIILIMIALLAAVTITITRMGDNTAEVSQEEASVIASQVLRQAKTIANGVDGLLAKGCSITQLSFENSTVTGYTNAQSPSDKSCWLFDAAGAGLSFPTPPPKANDGSKQWIFDRNQAVLGVGPERETGVANTSSTCNAATPNCQDLVMLLPLVDMNVCKAINFLLGLSSYAASPIQNLGKFDMHYKFSTPSSSPDAANYSLLSSTHWPIYASGTPISTNALWDKKTGCAEASGGYMDETYTNQSGNGKYFFYQVLVER